MISSIPELDTIREEDQKSIQNEEKMKKSKSMIKFISSIESYFPSSKEESRKDPDVLRKERYINTHFYKTRRAKVMNRRSNSL